MANPLEVLSKAPILQKATDASLKELIQKAFTTRNLLHFAHWSTSSYAAHQAVGELYDDIIDKIDDIAEVYMGKFGKIDINSQEPATMPQDLVAYIKAECDWMCDNKRSIAKENGAVLNLLDELEAAYQKTIYKLENLN